MAGHQLLRQGRGALGVHVGDDHVSPLGRQPPAYALADAVGAAGDQGDPPDQGPLPGGQGQLVQLHGPVLGLKGVPLAEGGVAPHGLGGGQHVYGVTVHVRDDGRSPGVLSRRPHPHPGRQDDPGIGIAHGDGPVRVPPVPALIRLDVAVDAASQGLPEGRKVLRVLDVHPQGDPLRVDQVVRRGRAYARQMRRHLSEARRSSTAGGVVVAQDPAGGAADQTPQGRRQGRGDLPAAFGGGRQQPPLGRGKDGLAPGLAGRVLLGPGHQVDVTLVGLPGVVAPSDQTVVGQHHAAAAASGPRDLADQLGQPEPGPEVLHHRGVVAVGGPCHCLSADRRCW